MVAIESRQSSECGNLWQFLAELFSHSQIEDKENSNEVSALSERLQLYGKIELSKISRW